MQGHEGIHLIRKLSQLLTETNHFLLVAVVSFVTELHKSHLISTKIIGNTSS